MTDFYESPRGEFHYPWLTKPDTQFNDDGLYKVGLIVSGDNADALKAKIEAASQAALDEHTEDMTSAKRKKWSLYVPFEDYEEEDGSSEGRTVFNFKQNAIIKKRDGDTIDVQITMYDAKGNEVEINVFSGTIGKVMFSMRPIVMASSFKCGVRLDFFQVQIIKPSKGNKRKSGFSSNDDGWDSAEGEAPKFSKDDDDGDY